VTVTDGGGLTTFREFTATVGQPPASTPPTVTEIADLTLTPGQRTSVLFATSDPDATLNTFGVGLFATSSNPAVVPLHPALYFRATFGGNVQELFVPTTGTVGTSTITVVVVGARGAYTTRSFDVTVAAPSTNLSLSLTGASVPEFRPAGTVAGTLSATPAGPYSFSLVAGTGADDNAAFAIVGNQLVTARPFEFATKSSYSVRVRVTDGGNQAVEKAFAIAVTDDPSLVRVGRSLQVTGTAAADTFGFAAGTATHTVVLNGTARAVPKADVDEIVFHGAGGADVADLTAFGTGNRAALAPRSGTLSGNGYVVRVGEVGTVIVRGSAGDAATLDGSAGDDTFAGTPTYANMVGAGYSNFAVGFGNLAATAGGGADVAYLAGSAGADTFVGTPTYAALVGGGFSNYAVGFDNVVGYANGGADTAYLAGGAGADTLAAYPTAAILVGGGYYNAASGFRSVVAYANDAADAAYLYDSAGNDVFVGTESYSAMTGDGYGNYAAGFRTVVASASAGGTDAAYLADTAGDDEVSASVVSATLTWGGTGAGKFASLTSFDSVLVYGTNGGRNRKRVGPVSFFLDLPGVWLA
jgi:hypothetical protein